MLDRPIEYEQMAEAESKLWWYKNLHNLVTSSLEELEISFSAKILDAGCGTGGLLNFLRERGYQNLTGVDLSLDAVTFCRKKNLEVRQGAAQNLASIFGDKKFDVIICNDVLCYFSPEQAIGVLKNFRDSLTSEGALVINIPAYKIFSGIHDIAVGIKHRGSKGELQKLLFDSNYRVIKSIHWPFFLSPIIFFERARQRICTQNLENIAPERLQSDVVMPSPFVNDTLYAISNIENFLFAATGAERLRFIGSSVFVVCRA